MSTADSIKALQDALKASMANVPEYLIGGSALEIEDLDLYGIGLYSDAQKDQLLKDGVPEDDFFLKTLMGTTMWARKSDEGKK